MRYFDFLLADELVGEEEEEEEEAKEGSLGNFPNDHLELGSEIVIVCSTLSAVRCRLGMLTRLLCFAMDSQSQQVVICRRLTWTQRVGRV
jgi:hypothetical protein